MSLGNVILTAVPISVPTIPGDFYPDEIANNTHIPSAFKLVEYSCNVTVELELGGNVIDIDSVVVSGTPFSTITALEVANTSNSVTFLFAGTVSSGVFDDEEFTFLFSDGSTRVLPPDNAEDWDTLTSWKPPSDPTYQEGSYGLTIEYIDPDTMLSDTYNGEIKQWVFWNFTPSLNAFSDLLSRGKY